MNVTTKSVSVLLHFESSRKSDCVMYAVQTEFFLFTSICHLLYIKYVKPIIFLFMNQSFLTLADCIVQEIGETFTFFKTSNTL